MEITEAPATPMSGQVMFYSNPEGLNPDLHAGLGLKAAEKPFAFAAQASAIPLIVNEFGPASLHYPIVFAGPERQPLAIMSIRPNESLFIGEDGMFPPDTYVPAFIRRYPFVLAVDQGSDQLVVCINRDDSILVPGGEVPLFEGREPSEFVKGCIEFCSNFETERRRTDDFVKILKDLDLFELKTVTLTPGPGPDGRQPQPIIVSEYFSPSEERVRGLSAEKLVELRDNGVLQQIYAHQNSLLNWEKLINQTMRRYPGAPAAANA